MTTPAEPSPLSRDELLAIEADAARALMERLLSSRQWIVATLHIEGGTQPRIAAANVYGSLPQAMDTYDQLAAEIDSHEHVTLIPVGPITPAELAAARPVTGQEDNQ